MSRLMIALRSLTTLVVGSTLIAMIVPAALAAHGLASDGAAADAIAAEGDATRVELSFTGNEARYRAQERLVGRSLPNEAVGWTPDVPEAILLDLTGALLPAHSKIVVDLRTLRSDESRRDNWIQRNTLETHRFPTAEFVPASIVGIEMPLPTSGQAELQMLGDLTVHGVTQPTTWTATVQFGDQTVTGTAWIQVRMTDFGMTPPRVGPVLSIEDAITLEMDFSATVGADLAAATHRRTEEPRERSPAS